MRFQIVVAVYCMYLRLMNIGLLGNVQQLSGSIRAAACIPRVFLEYSMHLFLIPRVCGPRIPGSFEAVQMDTLLRGRYTFSARGISVFTAFLTCQISNNVHNWMYEV